MFLSSKRVLAPGLLPWGFSFYPALARCSTQCISVGSRPAEHRNPRFANGQLIERVPVGERKRGCWGLGRVEKTPPGARERVVFRARLSKCLFGRKSVPARNPGSRRRACPPKPRGVTRRSRFAGFHSGRGRFAAPLFLSEIVVRSKDSFPLKHRSCYQCQTQHSGYSQSNSTDESSRNSDITEPSIC